MRKRALIEQLIEGRDGMIRTAVLRTPEGNKFTRPVRLVIPLEVDQGGEEWRNAFLLSTNWMPPLEVVVYLSCKLFTNKLCVSQDGVLFFRPVVTTPNNKYQIN